MTVVLQPKPPPLAHQAETVQGALPGSDGAPRDGWATWVASEQRRREDTSRELRTALLVALVVLALGGAIYLSFVGAP
ncbi:MAG: hypothetical protein AB7O28_17120 [Vicinamibacterales bacterium]